jgi:hypothetical protein
MGLIYQIEQPFDYWKRIRLATMPATENPVSQAQSDLAIVSLSRDS